MEWQRRHERRAGAVQPRVGRRVRLLERCRYAGTGWEPPSARLEPIPVAGGWRRILTAEEKFMQAYPQDQVGAAVLNRCRCAIESAASDF